MSVFGIAVCKISAQKGAAILLSGAVLLLCSSLVRAVPGSLDITFGGTGMRSADFGTGSGFAKAVAIQSDGKLVTAGYFGDFTSQAVALARFNTDGTLDATFDGDGKVTTSILGADDIAAGLVIQPDGKIIVAGHSLNGLVYHFALVRYNSNGSLDTSFDGDGIVTTAFGLYDSFANAVVIQADGKIVAAGSSYNGTNFDFAIVRYLSTGSLDAGFDGDGKLTTAVLGDDDAVNAVAIQTDNQIVAIGYASTGLANRFAAARYNSNGSLDTTFDTDGKIITSIGSIDDGASDVVLQTDGKIVLAGFAHNGTTYDIALARYASNGLLDTTFDSDGLVTTPVLAGNSFAHTISLQSDGKLVVAGAVDNGVDYDLALARYGANGSLDVTYSGDGKATFDLDSLDNLGYASAIDSFGRVVVAGESGTTFMVARILGDLNPSSAAVAVSGRITTAGGLGIRNARVTLTDVHGTSRYALTGAFGFYRFEEVTVGGSYVISVASKKYDFLEPTQLITVTEKLGEVDFTAAGF